MKWLEFYIFLHIHTHIYTHTLKKKRMLYCPQGLETVTENWHNISYVPKMFSLPSPQVTNAFTVIHTK